MDTDQNIAEIQEAFEHYQGLLSQAVRPTHGSPEYIAAIKALVDYRLSLSPDILRGVQELGRHSKLRRELNPEVRGAYSTPAELEQMELRITEIERLRRLGLGHQ